MRRIIVALAVAFAIAAPASAVDVQGTSAQIGWGAASGPVESYIVYEARNGSGFTAGQTTTTTRATVTGAIGDSVRVRVLAMGRSGQQLIFSPLSEVSEPINFVEPPDTNPPPTNPPPPPPPTNPPPTNPPTPVGTSGFVVGSDELSGNRVMHFPADSTMVRSTDSRFRDRFESDVRPIYCNLDGDADDELVVGYGPGSAQVLTILDDASRGHLHLATVDAKWWSQSKKGREKRKNRAKKKKWKKLFEYARKNGEVNPTCGDFDGDGRDEIIAGLGATGFGWAIYVEDARQGYSSSWFRLGRLSDGSTRPAAADIDGDGRDELVIGYGPGTNNSLYVVDDLTTGFAIYPNTPDGRGWISFKDNQYASVNGETRPVGCDIDGDGRDEIVVGLGIGGGGRVMVLDDGRNRFRFQDIYTLGNLGSYRRNNGETHPSCGDIDGDGYDEIAVGLGSGGNGRVHMLESDGRALRNRYGANGSGIVSLISGGSERMTWPAVAR